MTSQVFSIPVQRGCGYRVEGGIYFECGLSPDGKPIEEFLCDPTIPVDTETLGLSPIGQVVKVTDTKTYIFDWIGKGYYPNATDWIEEVRRYGMSQRAQLTPDQYASLPPQKTYVIAVHPTAHAPLIDGELDDWQMMNQWLDYDWAFCPHRNYKHVPHFTDVFCAGLLWNIVDALESGWHDIQRPSFQYRAYRMESTPRLSLGAAMIGIFPVQRIAVIGGSDSAEALESLFNLRDCKIPTVRVEA